MPRRRSTLWSRTSRSELPTSDAPVWELIGQGVRLGYRRGRAASVKGGAWLAASRTADGKRQQARLGRADDVTTGEGRLSYEEAREAARRWAKALRTGDGAPPPLTVDDALDRYFDARAVEGMKSVDGARRSAALHIRPSLGSIRVADLKLERLRQWRDDVVRKPKQVRTAKYAETLNVRPLDPDDAEGLRSRRETVNRVLRIFKAALNWAYKHDLVESDKAWRLLDPYRGTISARTRFLETAEQQRLLNTTQGELRDLVAAALMTGARFGELTRLTVRDFSPTNETIYVASSKSGKARHVPLTAGGLALFGRLAIGKAPTALLLTRENGDPWRPRNYQRAFREALSRAVIEPMTLHELRHSYASTMVRAGAPLMVVAQALGHADTRMAERHYAHLAPSYVADTIRRTAPDLRITL